MGLALVIKFAFYLIIMFAIFTYKYRLLELTEKDFKILHTDHHFIVIFKCL